MAKTKYIETPEMMLKLWNEYKDHVKSNPRFIYQLDKVAEVFARPQVQNFWNSYGADLAAYKRK